MQELDTDDQDLVNMFLSYFLFGLRRPNLIFRAGAQVPECQFDRVALLNGSIIGVI